MRRQLHNSRQRLKRHVAVPRATAARYNVSQRRRQYGSSLGLHHSQLNPLAQPTRLLRTQALRIRTTNHRLNQNHNPQSMIRPTARLMVVI